MKKDIDTFTDYSEKLSTYAVVILVFLTFFQVLARYVLTPFEIFSPLMKILNPILLQELEWHVFAFIFLIGLAFTLRSDDHVRVDIFYAKMSEKKKQTINRWGFIFLFLPLCIWILWVSVPYAINNFTDGTPNPGGIPIWGFVKILLPVGMVLLLLEHLRRLMTRSTEGF